jgi:hypothetical protein
MKVWKFDKKCACSVYKCSEWRILSLSSRDEKRYSDDETKMQWKAVGYRFRHRYRIIRNRKM